MVPLCYPNQSLMELYFVGTILGLISIGSLVYAGYKDWLHAKHIKDLELKLMSKNAREYVELFSEPEPNQIEPSEGAVPIEELTLEKLEELKRGNSPRKA